MKIKLLFFLFFFSFFIQTQAQTSSSEMRNRRELRQWLKQRKWSGGLQLNPDKTVDIQEFYRQYKANKSSWDKAFAFMREHDLNTLSKGRYVIDGEDVFATVTENPTRDYDSTQWESHRRYIDLQYIIKGKEMIGVQSINKLRLTKPYDENRDVANYSGDGKLYEARPKYFFLFFHTDAHRPGISAAGKNLVKKIVIKIRSAE